MFKKRGNVPWNKSKIGLKGHPAWNKGKHFVHSGSFKKGHKPYLVFLNKERLDISGKNHFGWKGGVSFKFHNKIHRWIERKRGKAKYYICEFCKKRQAYEWANLEHTYKKELNDYRTLCRSCHRRWDIKYNNYNNLHKRTFKHKYSTRK